MEARHQNATRRSADRAARIVIAELETFGGQLVDMGSGKKLLSVATEITVTGIIEEHVDDVGFLFLIGPSAGNSKHQKNR